MPESTQGMSPQVRRDLVEMASLVETAIGTATVGLLTTDPALANIVVRSDRTVDDLRQRIVRQCERVVAGAADGMAGGSAARSRWVAVALAACSHLGRMGESALGIARSVLNRRRPLVPPRLRPDVERMSRVAQRAAALVRRALSEPDSPEVGRLAAEMERDDDLLDAMQHDLLSQLLHGRPADAAAVPRADRDGWDGWDGDDDQTSRVHAALDVTLLARHYSRYVDHAGTVMQRLAEAADASAVRRSYVAVSRTAQPSSRSAT
jgi:phosphate transport system protein